MAIYELSKSRTVKCVVRYGGVLTTKREDFSSHYKGGCTKIIKLDRRITYKNFVARLCEISGCSDWKLRIKLPAQEEDTLISVACEEDLETVLQEHDMASTAHPDDPPKLRAFLSSPEHHHARMQWSGPAPVSLPRNSNLCMVPESGHPPLPILKKLQVKEQQRLEQIKEVSHCVTAGSSSQLLKSEVLDTVCDKCEKKSKQRNSSSKSSVSDRHTVSVPSSSSSSGGNLSRAESFLSTFNGSSSSTQAGIISGLCITVNVAPLERKRSK